MAAQIRMTPGELRIQSGRLFDCAVSLEENFKKIHDVVETVNQSFNDTAMEATSALLLDKVKQTEIVVELLKEMVRSMESAAGCMEQTDNIIAGLFKP